VWTFSEEEKDEVKMTPSLLQTSKQTLQHHWKLKNAESEVSQRQKT